MDFKKGQCDCKNCGAPLNLMVDKCNFCSSPLNQKVGITKSFNNGGYEEIVDGKKYRMVGTLQNKSGLKSLFNRGTYDGGSR